MGEDEEREEGEEKPRVAKVTSASPLRCGKQLKRGMKTKT